ncbi:OstA-like protein [Catalinimonas niigatensis]|uniref:OstA-like protein n=1 Tax=Catalinimonas niigatensis TaxID=1397264 RepID=UPI0026655007|nr:OstA-like protein [Catalinimonas niigatensis]WPP52474.1 OstA-like protein [Catalinimonas niigatensis]
MKIVYFFLPVLFLFVCSVSALGQGKINIENADTLQGGKNKDNEQFRKLIGNVILRQGNTRIFGDSVILYTNKNISEVFGERVRVEDGDSIKVIGDRLIYNGNTRVAQMRDDVIYTTPSMTLYSDHLDYDLPANLAYYYGGGKLVDSTNVLTSKEGTYHTATNLASFKDNVILVTPDYKLESDTLQYNTVSKVAYTLGPTLITSNDGTQLVAEAGSEFRTLEEQSMFGQGTVETEKYIISGDRLFLDDVNKLYRATSNVEMISKDNNVIITGDSAIYYRNRGLTKVYGKAVMRRPMELDTLYLSADTLVSVEDSIPSKERILAYHDVRIYRSDLQALSDSLAYHITDSILYLYRDPILWNDKSQIEADSINLEIIGGQVRRMNTIENSFVISKDTINNFNQVKGREMVVDFDQGTINKIDVNGNGESIYFVLERDSIMVGMNHILCSNMVLRFEESGLNNISFYTKPNGKLIPPHELTKAEKQLQGFQWRISERPTKEQVVERTELKRSDGIQKNNEILSEDQQKIIQELNPPE